MTEVSRNLVAMLLILVIVISGFGTWSLLTTSKITTSAAPVGDVTDSSGHVALSIEKTPQDNGRILLDVNTGANHG